MPRRIALLVVLTVVAAGPALAGTRMLVGEVKGEEAAALTRVIESEVVRAVPDVQVLTWRAVAATLETAEVASCLGDEETAACAAEVGGALGVDLIMSPHLATLGSVRVLTVSVYRMADATVAAQTSRRAPAGDDEALLDEAVAAVDEALAAAGLRVVAPPPVERLSVVHDVQADDDGAGALAWGIGVGGVGAGAGLALVGGLIHVGVLLAWALPYERGELTLGQARAWERDAAVWLAVPWIAYAASAVLVVGGVAAGWVLHE